MRRQLIVTVAASVSMVLVAMLVPMAVLLQNLALEDRIARASLEVQATETVVSTADDDRGDVAVYIATINDISPDLQTTVLYPGGVSIGPHPDESDRVADARLTGIARIDDVPGGAEILVPVSLGARASSPEDTPVVRVRVAEPALLTETRGTWLILAALGLVLLAGALVLADRLGRSFVRPIEMLANYTSKLGAMESPPSVSVTGPAEIRQLGQTINRLVERIETLRNRERERVSDLSHRLRTPATALLLRIESLPPSDDRDRLANDLSELRAMIDQLVREARRSEREGLVPEADAAAILAERARYWAALAEDQGRPFELRVTTPGRTLVRAAEADLIALLDVLLDNVFTHTPDAAGVRVLIEPRAGGGALLSVTDEGPGIPASALVRGSSAAGSTGLGLAIAQRTAEESGGSVTVENPTSGGGRVLVELGPSAS